MKLKPRERAAELVRKRMEKNKVWASGHIRAMTTPVPVVDDMGQPKRTADGGLVMRAPWQDVAWKERSVADVAALQIATIHEANERANKLAQRPQIQLGVVVVPAQSPSIEDWERDLKRLEGRSDVIDVKPEAPKAS